MWAETDQVAAEQWDEAVARDLIGSIVLVGITYLDPEGNPEGQSQCYGLVTAADRENGS
jgi:hypothetical protein